MWCTRTYLPLLILPFSTASPLFLCAFVLSLSLQARPCLYCIVLLAALSQASCYWHPVPASSLLTSPSGLPSPSPLSSTPSATNENGGVLDGYVPLISRCWCDIRRTGFFEPLDVKTWEKESLDRELERRRKEEALARGDDNATLQQAAQSPLESRTEAPEAQSSANAKSYNQHVSPPLSTISNRLYNGMRRRLSLLQSTLPLFANNPSPHALSSPSRPNLIRSSKSPSNPSKSSTVSQPTSKPLLRKRYDLRDELGIVLDFGWGRSEV